MLDEFEKSGMSGAQFARLTGLNYSSFQNWVQRRRHTRGAQFEARKQENATTAGRAAVRLFEAVMADGEIAQAAPTEGLSPRGVAGLLIELPGASRMHVETPVQLRMAAELLALIAQSTRARC
jgi:AraC-like DNA-binding protein